MYAISRFQCGVTINPKEYVRDKNNEVIKFKTKDDAVKFLMPRFDFSDNQIGIKHLAIEILEDHGVHIEKEKENA